MELIHSANGDIIIHYGVKGMKWGVRKARRMRSKTIKNQNKIKKYASKIPVYSSKRERANVRGEFNKRDRYDNKITVLKNKISKLSVRVSKGRSYVERFNNKALNVSRYDLNNGYEFVRDYLDEYKRYKETS